MRRGALPLLLAAGIAAIALALPRDAEAFCRTTTKGVAPDFQPTRDRCWDQGVPLFWKNACVGYSINRFASKQVSYEDAANAIAGFEIKGFEARHSKWERFLQGDDGALNARDVSSSATHPCAPPAWRGARRRSAPQAFPRAWG